MVVTPDLRLSKRPFFFHLVRLIFVFFLLSSHDCRRVLMAVLRAVTSAKLHERVRRVFDFHLSWNSRITICFSINPRVSSCQRYEAIIVDNIKALDRSDNAVPGLAQRINTTLILYIYRCLVCVCVFQGVSRLTGGSINRLISRKEKGCPPRIRTVHIIFEHA